MTVQQHPGLKRFIPTPLKRVLPVPSDIEIAQAATLKPITTIAEELGVQAEELELFGPHKAKVKLEDSWNDLRIFPMASISM